MDMKCSAVVRCEYCHNTFREDWILLDDNGNTEVCPFCGEKNCFTTIQMGD